MEVYKELNADLVQKVQDLKIIINDLEKETNKWKSLYFDERQQRFACQNAIRKISSTCNIILSDANEEDSIEFSSQSKANENRRLSENLEHRSSLTNDSFQRRDLNSNVDDLDRIEEGVENASPVRLTRRRGLRDTPTLTRPLHDLGENTNRRLTDVTIQAMELSKSFDIEININPPSDSIGQSKQALNIDIEAPERLMNNLTSPVGFIAQACSTPKPMEDETNATKLDANSSEDVTAINHRLHKACASNITSNEKSAIESESDIASTSTGSQRPRRACAPNSLVEPKLGGKLRNESGGAKPKNSRRKQNKTS